MNICITPELFTIFCQELLSMLSEREQMQNIDLTAIKQHVLLKQAEYCE